MTIAISIGDFAPKNQKVGEIDQLLDQQISQVVQPLRLNRVNVHAASTTSTFTTAKQEQITTPHSKKRATFIWSPSSRQLVRNILGEA